MSTPRPALSAGYYWYVPVLGDALWDQNTANDMTIVKVDPWDAEYHFQWIWAVGREVMLESAQLPGPFLGPLVRPQLQQGCLNAERQEG